MRTFILASFITTITCIVVRAVLVSIVDYPRSQKITLGSDLVNLLAYIAWGIWAGWLLFAK